MYSLKADLTRAGLSGAWDVLSETPKANEGRGIHRLVWELLQDKRASWGHRRDDGAILDVRPFGEDWGDLQPPKYWTAELVTAVYDSSCECAVCVVYGGDCPAMLRHTEFVRPMLRRYLRGMRRASHRGTH